MKQNPHVLLNIMKNFVTAYPKKFIKLLNEIHQESIQSNVPKSQQWDYRPTIVLMTVAVCLLMLNYLKFSSVFIEVINVVFNWFSTSPSVIFNHKFYALMAQTWWSLWHVLSFVIVPVIVIKYLLNDSLYNYGLGLGQLTKHYRWYLLLVSIILFFVFLVSFRDDFSTHYPFYKQASRSWFDLLAWEFLYLIQFVCVEFFFRGFIVQSCRPSFGVNAIFVMIVPYLMLHFTKPWIEATGAILFGLFLGVLALRSRSIWGGVMVHISIALSMDVAALLQTRGLPIKWWP